MRLPKEFEGAWASPAALERSSGKAAFVPPKAAFVPPRGAYFLNSGELSAGCIQNLLMFKTGIAIA